MISGLKENYLRQSVTGLLFPGSLKNSANLIFSSDLLLEDFSLGLASFLHIFYLFLYFLLRLYSPVEASISLPALPVFASLHLAQKLRKIQKKSGEYQTTKGGNFKFGGNQGFGVVLAEGLSNLVGCKGSSQIRDSGLGKSGALGSGMVLYPVDLPNVHLQTIFSFEEARALVTLQSLHCWS